MSVRPVPGALLAPAGLLPQERPPGGQQHGRPLGGAVGRAAGASQQLQLVLAFPGGSAELVGDTGTARPPASRERQLVQAAACQRRALENWAVAMSPVPAGARGFTLALAWWFLSATPSQSQRRMGRVAQGWAASSACVSVRLCPPPSHYQGRVKYFPLLQP